MTTAIVICATLMALTALPYFFSLYKEHKTIATFKKEGVRVYTTRFKRFWGDFDTYANSIFAHLLFFIFFILIHLFVFTIFGWEAGGVSHLMLASLMYATIFFSFKSFSEISSESRLKNDEIRFQDLVDERYMRRIPELVDSETYLYLLKHTVQYGTESFYSVQSIQKDMEKREEVWNAIFARVTRNGIDNVSREAHSKMLELDKKIVSVLKMLKTKDTQPAEQEDVEDVLTDFIKEQVKMTIESPEIKELQLLLEEELSPEQRETVVQTLEEIQNKRAQKTEEIDNDMRVNSIVRAARMMNRLE